MTATRDPAGEEQAVQSLSTYSSLVQTCASDQRLPSAKITWIARKRAGARDIDLFFPPQDLPPAA